MLKIAMLKIAMQIATTTTRTVVLNAITTEEETIHLRLRTTVKKDNIR